MKLPWTFFFESSNSPGSNCTGRFVISYNEKKYIRDIRGLPSGVRNCCFTHKCEGKEINYENEGVEFRESEK